MCVYVWGQCLFIYLLCVCGRGQCRVCHDKSGSQKTTCRVISLLLHGLIGLNAGFQTWYPVTLPSEPSCWPTYR